MNRIAMVAMAALLSLAFGACGGDGKGVENVGNFCHGEEDGTPCDDGNSCTDDDRCGLGICEGRPLEDGAACEDGTLCTVEDQCFAGQCQGTELVCPASLDGACTVGVCLAESGECVAEPANDGGACDDGSLCTADDLCDAGKCEGTTVECLDPLEPCITGACNPDSGECQFEPVPEGGECDDENLCTQSDMCIDGQCLGTTVDCSDLLTPCQDGVCDPADGLCKPAPVPSGTVCDDGNPCTDGETCKLGNCGGGVQVPDGNLCDDGNKCTVGETCLAGECIALPMDCSEISNSACIEGVCDPDTGECTGVPVEDPACSCWGAEDGEACDDGLACTLNDTCDNQLCIGEVLDCSDFGDICNDGVCNPANGKCTRSPANEGGDCDDDLTCSVADICVAGVCTGDVMDCSELDGPCSIGACDEASGKCEALINTDGTPCDDGDVCTGNDHCEEGACTWGFDLCAACDGLEVGAACEEGDACTLNSTCKVTVGKLVCLGQNLQCPDMGPCMFGMCEPSTGECIPKPLPNGLFCFDQDPCTVTDVCGGGQCHGSPKDCGATASPCAAVSCQQNTGVCQVAPAPDKEDCDDGDLCTTNDACFSGLCKGTSKVCEGADGQCIEAVCDPETGDCGVPLPDGTKCDDLNVCTTQDTCQGGLCIGNDICFCMDKLDGTPCDDGYKCTQGDACKKGGCAGQPIDCSAADSVCNLGACEPATGACVPVPVQDGNPCADGNNCTVQDSCKGGVCKGTPKDCSNLSNQCGIGVCGPGGTCVFAAGNDDVPCDDGDFCTSGDACDEGTCTGQVNVCLSCAGKNAGDVCDDGDLCTEGGACLEISGVLVCVGQAKDCSYLDTGCAHGVCDIGTGECVAKPKANKLPCEDGDPCTTVDQCTGGKCAGTEINMCGFETLQCEAPTPNDKMKDAILLPPSMEGVTVFGRIDPAGETDWYSVPVETGQLVSVLAHSHCGSILDTQIGVYYPDGVTPLASADDGGEDGWSLIEPVEATESGLFLIGLTAFSASGIGNYLLDVKVATPPPCQNDAACGCDQMTCVFAGPKAGLCVPDMGLEAEPNNSPQTANSLTIESQTMAEFGFGGDQDWFVATLQPDIPITVETGSFCQEVTDPKVWIYNELGTNVLASDSDSAGEGHARISKFVAPSPGKYRIKVQDESEGVGAYVLSLLDARCKTDDDCGCQDQQCDGTPEAPGSCVPLIAVPEMEDDSQPVPVVLGKRVHAELETPYDLDTFVVSLAPGKYTIETLSYCGLETDTHLLFLAPDGTELGEDEDNGNGFFAAISGVEAKTIGNYVIEVAGYGPSVGEYILRVSYAQAGD